MDDVLEDRLDKIAKKKQNLLQLEKIIRDKEKEKEKKLRAKRNFEIGELATKANIDKIDNQALLGAFIEISKRLDHSETVKTWKIEAEKFYQKLNSNDDTPLSISFKKNIDEETKILLKNFKFKWNKFRKEFYGYGNKTEIENLLKKFECVIEVIN